MIAALVHGFFTRLLITPLSQMLFVLIVGVSTGIYFSDHYKDKSETQRAPVFVKGIIVVTILLSFVSVTYWGMHNSIERNKFDNYYLQKTERNRVVPRFWMQGIIGFDYSGMKKEDPQTAVDSLQEEQNSEE